jgi:phosphoesterase RecJ-like protein
MEKLQLKDVDTEDVVAIVRSIYGVNMTIFFKEMETDQFRVSIRSRGQANAQFVASRFEGGGHQHAAGFNFTGSIEQGIASVLDVIASHLEK